VSTHDGCTREPHSQLDSLSRALARRPPDHELRRLVAYRCGAQPDAFGRYRYTSPTAPRVRARVRAARAGSGGNTHMRAACTVEFGNYHAALVPRRRRFQLHHLLLLERYRWFRLHHRLFLHVSGGARAPAEVDSSRSLAWGPTSCRIVCDQMARHGGGGHALLLLLLLLLLLCLRSRRTVRAKFLGGVGAVVDREMRSLIERRVPHAVHIPLDCLRGGSAARA